MRSLVWTTLARSLYVAAAFAATVIAYDVTGQMPDRSPGDWVVLASVLSALALLGGALATSVEMQEG